MTKNVHKKLSLFILSIIFSFALNAQQIDSSKRRDIIANIDTSKKWATASFGLNVGYALNKSTSTGWFSGDYNTQTTPNIGLSLRLNLGKRLSIGVGLNRYNVQLTSTKPLRATTEAPSTITSEPNYLLDFEGTLKMFYLVAEVPFELSYKFNKIKKHFIPMISVGTTYFNYNSTYLSGFTSEYSPFTRRISGSRPVEDEILRPTSSGFGFTNDKKFSPFVTIGIISALSEHSFVRLNAKCALNQNTATSFLHSKSEDITRSSNFKTLQLGLNVEYFITF
jgi:hypothetical protein